MTTARNLGILTGSAVTVAVLVVAVGVPGLGGDAGTAISRDPAPPPPAGVAKAGPTHREPAAAPDTAQAESAPLTATMPAPPVDTAPREPATAGPDAEIHWHSFWSPFGSQVAANGFVSRLQRVTGLDYRVVRTGPGVFEVAFAYTSDDDVTAGLELISAATGLELPAP